MKIYFHFINQNIPFMIYIMHVQLMQWRCIELRTFLQDTCASCREWEDLCFSLIRIDRSILSLKVTFRASQSSTSYLSILWSPILWTCQNLVNQHTAFWLVGSDFHCRVRSDNTYRDQGRSLGLGEVRYNGTKIRPLSFCHPTGDSDASTKQNL